VLLRLRHLGFAVAFLVVPSFADAKPPLKRAKLEPPSQRLQPGKSVGSPTEGHLVGGSHLADAPYVRIYPVYAQGDVRWGIEPLVGAIDHAARAVRKQFPDSVLSVGHLSKAGGGELDRHASHESGRDADVGFYIVNEKNKPVYADHMVAFKGDGTAPSWPGAKFDDARNWAFISSIVTDVHAHITHIFVSTPIRQRLLAYAAKIGAAPGIRVRASELMAQPHGALPHDDHFHIRVACPSGMSQCVEQPTARAHRKHSHPTATAHAKPPAQGSTPATPVKPAAPPVKSDETSSEASDETPNLGQAVPGLDAAVIPKPLEAPPAKQTPQAQPTPMPAPPVIDDPDGILEHP